MTNMLNVIEEQLNSKFQGCEIGLAEEALQDATLKIQIASIDDTLFAFRDIAGKYLKKGDGNIMARYRQHKSRLDDLVILYRNRTGIDLSDRLKCNRR